MADRIIKPDSGDQLVLQDEGGSDALVISTSGEITKALQPAFLAYNSATQSNLAVDTLIDVVWGGTDIFDQGGDFSSNTFTAPVTGRYQLNTLLRLASMDENANYYYWSFITSNRNYQFLMEPKGFDSDPTYWGTAMSMLVDMDASDTALVKIYQSGGSVQTDINADSYFSGYLVA